MTAGGKAVAACVLVALAAAGCGGEPPPPELAFQWPRPGSTVAPGEELHFRLAVDRPGTHAYQVVRTGVGPIGRAEGAGIATIPWQVPPDARPGERIAFTANARDAATDLVGTAETHVFIRATGSTGGIPPPTAAPAAEEWHGTWTGIATGDIYDDEVWVLFAFTIAPDGTLAGRGTGKLFTRPVRRGGCEYTHSQAPGEFDVTIGGRREGSHLALQLFGPGRVGRRTVTADCGANPSPHPAAAHDAFGMAGVFAAGLAPRVSIDGGRLQLATTDPASGMAVSYTTTIGPGRRETRTARP